MFDRIIAEGGDLAPILIYLVIFVIWAIGKALTAIKKNRPAAPPGEKAPPPRPARGARTLDPTLKDFLETLTGQKIETAPSPTPPRPPPILAAPPRRPKPVKRAPPPIQVPVALTEFEMEEADIYKTPEAPSNVIEETEIGEHVHFQEQALGSLSALAGMEALRMPMSSLSLPIQREKNDHFNPVNLRPRRAARRAVIERIVLGPPRCMHPDVEDQQTLMGQK